MTKNGYHHLPLLTDLLRFLEVDDASKVEGGILLVFLDEGGNEVTIRLRRTVADKLSRTLATLAKEERG
ncbi:MAG: hypothetical protein ACHP7N_04510 [Caulobacterales bacterium]